MKLDFSSLKKAIDSLGRAIDRTRKAPADEELRDAFSEADLPFKVDVVVWSMISEEFRSIIEERYDIVQQ